MKKMICFTLSILTILSIVNVDILRINSSAEDNTSEYATVKVITNNIQKKIVEGAQTGADIKTKKESKITLIKKDNKIYMSLNDICEFTRTHKEKADNKYILKQGLQEITVIIEDNGNSKLKSLYGDFNIQTVSENNKVYCEPEPIMSMLFAECTYYDNTLLIGLPQYTVYEATSFDYSKYQSDILSYGIDENTDNMGTAFAKWGLSVQRMYVSFLSDIVVDANYWYFSTDNTIRQYYYEAFNEVLGYDIYSNKSVIEDETKIYEKINDLGSFLEKTQGGDISDTSFTDFYISSYIDSYAKDECALIKQNGKYGIIQYDGTNIAEPIYKFGSYDIQGAIGVYNEYDPTKGTERVDVFSDKGKLKRQINQERGWGYVGSTYYWDNNKQHVYQFEGSPVYGEHTDNLSFNVVVQSADIEQDGKCSNISEKYGIANQNKLLVPIEYDKGYMHSFNNVIALEKEKKWTYFDKDRKVIIKNCDGFTSNNRVIDWWEGGDWYNYNNDYILPYIPTENYIPVKINGQCGYYDTQGNEVIPCGTFEEVRPVHNGLAWVKKDGKWGVIQLADIKPEESTVEETSDLIVETVKLTNSDIKSEWTYVTSLDLEYPIFSTSDKELQNFLNTAITEKILSYMATDTDYNVNIYGGFDYDMSIEGYLSVSANISNRAEGGNGFPVSCYTFFVDLKNKKVLQLNDLFSESEDVVYSEIALKAAAYINDDCSAGLLSKDALNNYDYKECKYTLTKEKLIITFSPYEISVGAAGIINIEIPVSALNLTCVIPEVKTKGFQNEDNFQIQNEPTEEQSGNATVSDYEILSAVNQYLEENKGHLGTWLTVSDAPYCPTEHMYSNDKNWSCPINLSWESYSSNEIAGAYPHFAYVNKETLKCTLTANYETVMEFDLKEYIK